MQNLPCPFCGSLEQELDDLFYDGPHYLIYCKCGAQAGVAEDEEGAFALWDRRSIFKAVSHEYLPCPFCGGQEQEEHRQGKDFWLWCKCGAQGSHARDRDGAFALWDTRIVPVSNRSEINAENYHH